VEESGGLIRLDDDLIAGDGEQVAFGAQLRDLSVGTGPGPVVSTRRIPPVPPPVVTGTA